MDNEATLKIRLETLSGTTLADLRKLKKELEGSFNVVTRGTPEQAALAAGIQKTKEEIASVTRLTETSNAKMMRSYFQLGQGLRSAQMAQINFSRVMQDAPFGLIAIQNNIEPLLTSLRQMKQEAKDAGVSFKGALIGSIMSAGGLIGAITMALPYIQKMTDYFSKLGERAEAAAERIYKAKRASGDISDPENVWKLYKDYQKRTRELSAVRAGGPTTMEKISIIGGTVPFFGEAFPGMKGAAESYRVREAEAEAALAEARTAWLLAAQELYKGTKPIDWVAHDLANMTGGKGKEYPLSAKYGGAPMAPLAQAGLGGQEFQRGKWFEKLSSGAAATVGAPSIISPDIMNAWDIRMEQFRDTLTDALTRGFSEGFRRGGNIFDQFMAHVREALLEIVFRQVASSIVNYALGALGSLGSALLNKGVDQSMSPSTSSGMKYMGGPTNPTFVSAPSIAAPSDNVSRQLRRINSSIEGLELRVDNQGLYMASARGKLLVEAR